MSMFDDLFGGMFDFNGDGETTLDEMLIAEELFFKDEEEESNSGDGTDGFNDFSF